MPKRVLSLLVGLLFTSTVGLPHTLAQNKAIAVEQVIEAPAPETICRYPVEFKDKHIYRRPHIAAPSRGKVASSTISVTYVDDDPAEPWPTAAKDAFDFAVSLWEATVTSSVPIEVEAHWADRGGCSGGGGIVLGSAGARLVWGLTVSGTTSWYVDPLADALIGSDLDDDGSGSDDPGPEIIARFNKDCDDPGSTVTWYFGTDGATPAGETDFVSVVLHEIGHGLGFSGSGDVDDGSGDPECSGTADEGCISSVLDRGDPEIYDRFVEDGDGIDLLDTGTYTNPSKTLAKVLGDALTGVEGGLFFDGTAANAANGGSPSELYAPSSWDPGSSYSHLDDGTFDGGDNALMTHALGTAEANHAIGGITCGMFEDMGWTIDAGAGDCNSVLPVELVAFNATVDGGSVQLAWETASETNNAGFEVQHRYFDDAFEAVDFVEGVGTTTEAQTYRLRVDDLDPGRHVFRLKQVDFNGAFEYSPEVEVIVELPDAYALSEAFPNPFNPETHFTLMLKASQHVTIDVYDVTARRVARLHEGTLAADALHRFRFKADDLPSGLYFYQVVGEQFAATKTMTLMK